MNLSLILRADWYLEFKAKGKYAHWLPLAYSTWRRASKMFFSWSWINSRIRPSSLPSRIWDRSKSNLPSISLARSRTRGSTFEVRNKLTTVSREGGVEIVLLGLLAPDSMLRIASKTCWHNADLWFISKSLLCRSAQILIEIKPETQLAWWGSSST
jgi:hypothetical protein